MAHFIGFKRRWTHDTVLIGFRTVITLLMLVTLTGGRHIPLQAQADNSTEATEISSSETGVSDARFARLAKGVNLSYWLWLSPEGDFDPDAITERDMQLLQAAGMTHIRLPFEPEKLMEDLDNPAQ